MPAEAAAASAAAAMTAAGRRGRGGSSCRRDRRCHCLKLSGEVRPAFNVIKLFLGEIP